MTNRYTKWCNNGCGKKVQIYNLIYWKHFCTGRTKRTIIYKCEVCGQMYKKKVDGIMVKYSEKMYNELVSRSIYGKTRERMNKYGFTN